MDQSGQIRADQGIELELVRKYPSFSHRVLSGNMLFGKNKEHTTTFRGGKRMGIFAISWEVENVEKLRFLHICSESIISDWQFMSTVKKLP